MGEYWISSKVSLRNTTLPGVIARLRPISKAVMSVCLMRRRPSGVFMSSSRCFRPSIRLAPLLASVVRSTSGLVKREIGGRQRIGDLLDIEAGLVAGVLVDALGVLHQVLRPVGGDQVELLEEVEDGVFLPVLVLEALVGAGGLGHRRGLLAQRLGPGVLPELGVGVPQLHLGIHQLLRIGHVGLRHGAERLRDLLHGGELGFGLLQGRVAAARPPAGR